MQRPWVASNQNLGNSDRGRRSTKKGLARLTNRFGIGKGFERTAEATAPLSNDQLDSSVNQKNQPDRGLRPEQSSRKLTDRIRDGAGAISTLEAQ